MTYELSEHKRRVAATYNLASAGYDQEAGRFFRLCANRLVELIGLQPGQRVLDAATGTGAAAIAAASRVGPAGHVVGVDIATDMLEQARRKSMAEQLTNIEFQEGDAEHLSYADISEIMELSPQAIKSLLSRARTNLREVLEPNDEKIKSVD